MLILRIVVFVAICLVVLLYLLFWIIDFVDRIETIREHAPWLVNLVEHKKWRGVILIACLLLLTGNVVELYQKEVPGVPSPPVVKLYASVPSIDVQGPCKLAADHVKPVLLPQACPANPSQVPNNEDPSQTIAEVNDMNLILRSILEKKQTVTVLMSWPDDDGSYLALVSEILESACRTTPRQCWFANKAGPSNLDLPPIKESSRKGLTIHGKDAVDLASALGRWFTTSYISSYPPELDAYKNPETNEMIWIEIGPGSPWKDGNSLRKAMQQP